jgi:putative ABC transport system substrate-binding protein
MRRREFITLLGGAAAAWPLAGRAQQAERMRRIGFLSPGSSVSVTRHLQEFRNGLNQTGFVEGQSVAIDYRWAHGRSRQVPALAAELVRQNVDAIVVTGIGAALAAKAATSTIPIVFYVGADPVETGLVASLSRPGGNLTGLTNLNLDLTRKRMEVLHDLLPHATTLAVLLNPANPTAETLSRDLLQAASALAVQLHVLHATTETDISAAFSDLEQLRAGGLIIGADAFFNTRSEQLGALTLRHLIPAIYQFREFTEAGGLMSYGGNLTEGYRLAGAYVGRVLKGEKPGDLPVQQFTKIELIINLKTAKALGINIPLPLIARADEVIE